MRTVYSVVINRGICTAFLINTKSKSLVIQKSSHQLRDKEENTADILVITLDQRTLCTFMIQKHFQLLMHSLTDTFSFYPTDPLVLTLVTADAFEADAAVARSRHVVTGGIVHTLTQLLTTVAKCPCWTLWTREHRFNTS